MDNKIRKTDRRTAFTKSLIKTTLLEMMHKKEFIKISVTELCKKIDIKRGTFYLHYYDMYDVLEELIDDLMSETTSLVDHIMCPKRVESGACSYPFCAKIQKESQYQVLFLDESISAVLLKKIADSGKEPFVTWLMSHSLLTFEQAEAVYYFQINGCLAVNRQMLHNKCTDWHKIQVTIDAFIRAGLEGYLAHDPGSNINVSGGRFQ